MDLISMLFTDNTPSFPSPIRDCNPLFKTKKKLDLLIDSDVSFLFVLLVILFVSGWQTFT